MALVVVDGGGLANYAENLLGVAKLVWLVDAGTLPDAGCQRQEKK
jgi:hypothetical protein